MCFTKAIFVLLLNDWVDEHLDESCRQLATFTVPQTAVVSLVTLGCHRHVHACSRWTSWSHLYISVNRFRSSFIQVLVQHWSYSKLYFYKLNSWRTTQPLRVIIVDRLQIDRSHESMKTDNSIYLFNKIGICLVNLPWNCHFHST